jgi:hypothetical protein
MRTAPTSTGSEQVLAGTSRGARGAPGRLKAGRGRNRAAMILRGRGDSRRAPTCVARASRARLRQGLGRQDCRSVCACVCWSSSGRRGQRSSTDLRASRHRASSAKHVRRTA